MALESPPEIADRQTALPANCSGWLAFAIYLALSLLFFGRGLIGHLSDRYIGIGTDPGLFIFFLEWWKYVFTHHVNPFFTYLQWAPTGANLAWATCIPLFGIAAIPLTATLGPIATFNLLTLLCPALAAWSAFLLCRYVSSSSSAALIGGYVFGFSPWMLSHLLGHLTVLMMFPAPLMVLVMLRRLHDEISARTFAITLSILLVAQFLCWPEAVATESLFGGVAIAIAWMTAPQWRGRLLGLISPTICAYVASAVLLSPYLYYFFAFGQPAFPRGLKQLVSVHPLNFLIPSTTNLLGTLSWIRALSIGGHIYEAGSYIALPMLLIVVGFARSHWHDWRARLLVTLLVVVSVASLGAALNIRNHRSIPMPWALLAHLPLMDKALPARVSGYSFLIMGIILSLWLSEDAIRKSIRLVGACAVVIFTLPNLSASFWATPVDTPTFFSTRIYTRYIAPGDNVLILPYGAVGNSNIWQAASGMYFRMAGGYLGQPPIPAEYLPYFSIVYDLFTLAESPFASEMLKTFLVQKKVNEIVVADEGAHLWRNSLKSGLLFPVSTELDSDERIVIRSLFATLGVTPIQVGGVSFYRVPLEKLDAYKNADPRDLERRSVAIQLDAVINAAERYISDGHPLADLNPLEAQRLGLLPPRWVSGVGIFNPRAPIQNGLVLSSIKNDDVLVGVFGARETIDGIVEAYRPYAKKVEITALIGIAGWAESSRWILLLEFNHEQIARAADFARRRNVMAGAVRPVPTASGREPPSLPH